MPQRLTRVTYRPDIDGLRGIAVAAVVLFHAGFDTFSGGFVGVDVFFVISGYLITGLIQPQIDAGRFSLREFYERRIRRLLPALAVMLAVVSLLCSVLLMPHDLASYGASLAAAAAFASNFLFWHDSGYFAQATELKPLLHTWSLGIEEQYYLIFPALLLWLHKRARRRPAIPLGLLLGASLLLSAWSATAAPRAGFYLMPARLWELLLGAMLALPGVVAPAHRLAREAAIAAGVALIACSIVGFDRHTPFPGTAALLPCLGTALVIWAGAKTSRLQRLLCLRPLVFMGLISYSLYLWHWPLLALLRQSLLRDPTRVDIAAVLATAAGIAIVSWRYVERPFRGRRGALASRQLFAAAAVATVAPIAAGALMYATDGVPQRLDPDIVALADPGDRDGPASGDCFNPSIAAVRAGRLCHVGQASTEPTFLLWGDSHADAIANAVGAAATAHGKAGLFAARAACQPLLDVRRVGKGNTCAEFNRAVATLVTGDEHIDTVLLAARWVIAARGTRYKFEPGDRVELRDPEFTAGETNEDVFRRGLERTLEALANAHKRIVVIGPLPEIGWRVPDVLAKAKYFGIPLDIGPTVAEFRARQQPVLDTFAALAAKLPFEVIWPQQVLCNPERCPAVADGKPLYRDEEHISAYGADRLIPLLSPIFEGAPAAHEP